MNCSAGYQTCTGLCTNQSSDACACPSGKISRYNYSAGENTSWIIGPAVVGTQVSIYLAVTSTALGYRVFNSNANDSLSVYNCTNVTQSCLLAVFSGYQTTNPASPSSVLLNWIESSTGVMMVQWVSNRSGNGQGWEVSWVSGDAPCLPCPYGFIMPSAGGPCVGCSAGYFSPPILMFPFSYYPSWSLGLGFSSCGICPAGSFQNQNNQTACNVCGPGTYNNLNGSSFCYGCPAGTFSLALGALTSSVCTMC